MLNFTVNQSRMRLKRGLAQTYKLAAKAITKIFEARSGGLYWSLPRG